MGLGIKKRLKRADSRRLGSSWAEFVGYFVRRNPVDFGDEYVSRIVNSRIGCD